jgi:acyl phosphate:glycerol-3-phosphate acyltransferase
LLQIILLVIGSYLVGSIPFGVIVGRLRGFDPRTVGSGNIGMTNVARAGGMTAAAVTFVGDVAKGAIPVLVARAMGCAPEVLALAAIAAFVGSICSVFLRFSGGKGISAALGVWLALYPLPIIFALAAFVAVFAIFRIVSLASLSAAFVLPPAVAALGAPRPYILLAIVITALVVLRFHENIARLVRGEEPVFQPRKRDSLAR